MRLLYLLGGIAFSLLGVALAGPSLQTLLAQVGLMAGESNFADAAAEGRAYDRVMAREGLLADVGKALRSAAKAEAQIPPPSTDRENGLYAYLRTLSQLPPPKSPPATRPADDAGLAERIRALKSEPPARLYAARYRALTWAAFQSTGVTPRRAALDADVLAMRRYAPVYRPVLRRLAGGLLAQAKAWREAGRAADAAAADEAVARLMLDLVDDSPRPDVVLMAAEYLPVALQGLADEAAAANLPPDVARSCVTEKARVLGVREQWHKAAPDSANILPRASTIALARPAHDRALGSVLASAYAIGVWLVLGVISLVLSILSAGFWGMGISIHWRWNGWGRLMAAGILAAFMLLVVLILRFSGLAFVWLYSMGSASAFVGAMLLVPVLVGLAARICVRLPEGHAGVWPSRKAVIIMAAIALLLTAIIAMIPAGHKPWHQPAGVQLLRRLGAWAVLASVVLTLTWMIWGGLRRRRLGLQRGPRSAACFGVAVWSWAAATVIGLIVLQVNAHYDLRHEAAFVAAAADPLADRLGPGWRAQHFQGTHELLNRLYQH